jgi:VWFA-related protein
MRQGRNALTRARRPAARWLALVSLAAVCAWLPLRARPQGTQTPTPPVFRGGVNLVQWDVSVYDEKYQPVTGLTVDRFTVIEDGKPRPIMGFAEINADPPAPPTAEWMRDAEADVTTNDVDDKQMFLLIVDDASFSKGRAGDPRAVFWKLFADRMQEIAASFFRHLHPGDLVSVVFTADNRRSQDFSSDHAKLLASVTQMTVPSMDPRLWAIYSPDIVRRATEALIAAPGRRKVIVDISLFDADVNVQTPIEQLDVIARKSLEAAQHANVSVFVVRPFDPPPDETWWANDWHDMPTGLSTLPPWSHILARDTAGGILGAGEDTASTEAAMDHLFLASGHYYMLGYVSADQEKFHQIKVSVDQPGVHVRTRETFYPISAPKPEKGPPPPPLMKSIAGLLPNSSVRMRATVAPFASAGPTRATVAMTLGLHQVFSTDGPVPASDDVQFRIGAFSAEGDPRGEKADGVLVPLRPNKPGEADYEILSTMALKPGLYSLRISAHSRMFDTDGSVYVTVEVPDFAKLPISFSGAIVSTTSGPPVAPRAALASIVSVLPTAQRTFARGQPVRAMVRAYKNTDKLSAPVAVRIRIVDEHDHAVIEESRSLPADFGQIRPADVSFDLPTTRLAPGQYLLSFEATVNKTTAKRDVRFVIR